MTIKLTREEAIQDLKAIKSFERYARGRLALDVAIEALEGVCFDEWCDDCKEYDTEKKCCPRFNRVIRGALNREPSEDGTLEVKVEDATKVGRVLISDDKHRGGLYYPDEDEPQSVSFENDTKIKSYSKDSDLISRAEAIEAVHDACNYCDTCGLKDVGCSQIRSLKELPSAGRPRGEQYKKGFEDAKRAFLVEYARESQNMRKRIAQLEARLNAQKAISADRPRGEWIDIGGVIRWGCSLCHYAYDQKFNFCPNCGAEMRGDTK